jgi:hypothetical protein
MQILNADDGRRLPAEIGQNQLDGFMETCLPVLRIHVLELGVFQGVKTPHIGDQIFAVPEETP